MRHRLPNSIRLVPDSATGYIVLFHETSIGRIYRDTHPPFRSWFFQNEIGAYGEVHTQKQAVDALLEFVPLDK